VFCVCSQFNDLGGCWDNTVQALARWQHPVASSEALDMLHQVMCPALHRRIPKVFQIASKLGVFFCIVDFVIVHNLR
jgi:hypothetical protein